ARWTARASRALAVHRHRSRRPRESGATPVERGTGERGSGVQSAASIVVGGQPHVLRSVVIPDGEDVVGVGVPGGRSGVDRGRAGLVDRGFVVAALDLLGGGA